MATSISDKAPDYKSLCNQWSPFLSKKHMANLQKATEVLSKVFGKSEVPIDQIIEASKQLDICGKRAEKRKKIISFAEQIIKECADAQKLLKPLQQQINKDLRGSNDTLQQGKIRECLSGSAAYEAFLSGVKKIVEETLKNFEKEFNKGVHKIYPKMMQNFAKLLKDANMSAEVASMPGHPIKQDLQAAMGGTNVKMAVQTKFDTLQWLAALKGCLDRAAPKLLMPPELLEAKELLVRMHEACQEKVKGLQEEKQSALELFSLFTDASKELQLKQQELMVYQDVCINYFSGLQDIMKQTLDAFEQETLAGVEKIYPTLMSSLIVLLKKSKLTGEVDTLPPCSFKNDLQTLLKGGTIQKTRVDFKELSLLLTGFFSRGGHALSLLFPKEEPSVETLAEKVDEITEGVASLSFGGSPGSLETRKFSKEEDK